MTFDGASQNNIDDWLINVKPLSFNCIQNQCWLDKVIFIFHGCLKNFIDFVFQILLKLLFNIMELPHCLYLSINTIIEVDRAAKCFSKGLRVFSHGIEYLSKDNVKLPFYTVARFLLNALHTIQILMELNKNIL